MLLALKPKHFLNFRLIAIDTLPICLHIFISIGSIFPTVYVNSFVAPKVTQFFTWIFLEYIKYIYIYSTHTYTHVQFEQFHKCMENRNKIYKKWYAQKQSPDIKPLGKKSSEKKK